MRQFNVFSELVVPYPNETFEWVANQSEGSAITLSPVSDWPLDNPTYTVEGGQSTTATAGGTAGAQGTFICAPTAAPGITTQTIVVASQGFISVCQDVNVMPGDYFIWQNTTSQPVVVQPDPANPNFWPLESQAHTVPPNGWLTVLVPEDAIEDNEYPLSITSEGGGAVCPEDAQPKIIVGSNK